MKVGKYIFEFLKILMSWGIPLDYIYYLIEYEGYIITEPGGIPAKRGDEDKTANF